MATRPSRLGSGRRNRFIALFADTQRLIASKRPFTNSRESSPEPPECNRNRSPVQKGTPTMPNNYPYPWVKVFPPCSNSSSQTKPPTKDASYKTTSSQSKHVSLPLRLHLSLPSFSPTTTKRMGMNPFSPQLCSCRCRCSCSCRCRCFAGRCSCLLLSLFFAVAVASRYPKASALGLSCRDKKAGALAPGVCPPPPPPPVHFRFNQNKKSISHLQINHIQKTISKYRNKITCQAQKPHKSLKTSNIHIAWELFSIRYN